MSATTTMERATLRDSLCNDSATLDRICHELRRPVAVISAYAEILADELAGPLNAEQKAQIAIMRRSAARLGRSIEDLFLVFDGAAAVRPPKLEEKDLEQLCYEVATTLEDAFVQRNVKLTLLTKGPLRHPAVDVQRLNVALVRILENVLAFASGGEDVVLELRRHGERVFFEITDPGPCLTKEDVERVFDFLYRPERNRISACDKGGADLSVCRVLIESLGGRVRAHNRAGAATTYVLELPSNGAEKRVTQTTGEP